ncbi:hypothetical protein H7F50_06560 [Novosphingobium flavum]|uniref:SH3b domain-containing protein n=1 Tax=Novosphingobium aerophilum TaxID=2839843 RepID=A0A7X1KB64_9SPHN|nr:hypothetical protein [Novosphingobium aerophilum]MBC2650883.1 hypothetical protein [Novosphingobium aerophilum]MBC2661412.1 hypothetical protein [Novosphingobium aerophilum]
MKAAINRITAVLASIGLGISPVQAQSADTVQDLLGQKQSEGEAALKSRGFQTAQTNARAAGGVYYWWNPKTKKCIRVATVNGLYSSITNASNKDCGYDSKGDTLAVAAVLGAAALGAILLSQKDKDKPDQSGQVMRPPHPSWQQFEVYSVRPNGLSIFAQPATGAPVLMQMAEGAILQGYGCQVFNREQWCEVSPNPNMAKGWALGRYLRPTGSVSPGHHAGATAADGELVAVSFAAGGGINLMSGPGPRDHVVGRVDAGSTLRRYSCHNAYGENWCQVATLDRRLNGWARARFLQPAPGHGTYPGYAGEAGSIAGLIGMDSTRAFNTLRSRGFDNVESFSTGGRLYSVYYHRPSRLCAQTAAEQGRIIDARDILSHPKCR